MRCVLALGVALFSACGRPDPNGFWKGTDFSSATTRPSTYAGMYFYDWDGGSYWNGKNIFLLKEVDFSLEQECSTMIVEGGRTRFTFPARPWGALEVVADETRLRLDSTGTWVEEGYRFRHPEDQPYGLERARVLMPCGQPAQAVIVDLSCETRP